MGILKFVPSFFDAAYCNTVTTIYRGVYSRDSYAVILCCPNHSLSVATF